MHFQPSKVEGPDTTMEYLRIELDSVAMEARLPAQKLMFLIELVTDWRSQMHCTLRKLQEFTRFLQFASQVVLTSQAFIRTLYNFGTTFSSPHAWCRITGQAHRNIE